jgi:hypothetical protein
LIYARFAPDDVEDGAIVKFIDAHTVALLLPTIDLEGALPRVMTTPLRRRLSSLGNFFLILALG